MEAEIQTWQDLNAFVVREFLLVGSNLTLQRFRATTKKSVAPLGRFALDNELFMDWGWEGVKSVARVNGWLGIRFQVKNNAVSLEGGEGEEEA